jgi:hypothetical protein
MAPMAAAPRRPALAALAALAALGGVLLLPAASLGQQPLMPPAMYPAGYPGYGATGYPQQYPARDPYGPSLWSPQGSAVPPAGVSAGGTAYSSDSGPGPAAAPAAYERFDPGVQAIAPPYEPVPTSPASTAAGPVGPLQVVSLTTTWLAGEDPGFWDFELAAVFGFPFPTIKSPLRVTPGFDWHLVDGPDGPKFPPWFPGPWRRAIEMRVPDLPPRLHDAYVDFKWTWPVRPDVAIDVGATPGWHSDFETGSSNALRVPARLIGRYRYLPDTELVLGIAYLDRDDVSFLPVGGINWTSPDGLLELELVFPRPRLSRQLGVWPGDFWWYVGGEFGGGSWAVRRVNGTDDVLNYYDIRLLLGLERRTGKYQGWNLEIGYVFARNIEFRSGIGNFEPDDTLLLRGGLRF